MTDKKQVEFKKESEKEFDSIDKRLADWFNENYNELMTKNLKGFKLSDWESIDETKKFLTYIKDHIASGLYSLGSGTVFRHIKALQTKEVKQQSNKKCQSE